MKTNRTSGNVLFLILIVVALFAALSYVVTQTIRNPSGNMSEYQMQLAFDEILNHVTSLRQAVQRIALQDGGEKVNAKFPIGSNPPLSAQTYPWGNGACPEAGLKKSCVLYHPQGGGVSFYDFVGRHPDLAPTPYDQYSTFLGWTWWGDGAPNPGFPKVGTPDPDINYSIRVTREFCDYINKRVGVAAVDSHTGFGSASTPELLAFRSQLAPPQPPPPSSVGLGGQYHSKHLSGSDMGCFYASAAGNRFHFISLIYLR